MKEEAQVAIQKAKESKLSQQEIAILTENGKALDEKLSDFKNQLDKLSSEFVIWKNSSWVLNFKYFAPLIL